MSDRRLPQRVLYYGKDEPLPERRELRAGPLALIFEQGGLRYVKLGGREILRGVYVAVRDRNWATIPAAFSNLVIEQDRDSFRIRFDAEHRVREIDFYWLGMINGSGDGAITFTIDGEARSTFLRNRIGFCALHPARECAGAACVIEQTDGAIINGVFPRHIAPHQPFKDMRAITHEVYPGLSAEVRFSGEIFEMEDQRNWTDASFKTYCTPLASPFPVEIKAGTKITQSVTLTLLGDIPELQVASPELTFSVGGESSGKLPRIGLGMSSHGQPMSRKELERIKTLSLAHLRVDLNLSGSDYRSSLRNAATESNELNTPLEVALTLSDAAETELNDLNEALAEIKPNVCRWLIFHTAEKSTTGMWINLARRQLRDYNSAAPIGAGTDAYFTDLNRGRPPAHAPDLVCFSINPQVHAFDNESLVETLETQAAIVASARGFIGGLPLAVTPVTLKPRFNPNATGIALETAPGELPSQVDVRQMSLFGAAWTVGSLKYLAESEVESVTFYETTGWRGVMECEGGSPNPEKFRSLPGAVFPLYHALADVGEFAGAAVIPSVSSDTMKVNGLALRKGGLTRILLVNLTAEPQRVTVRNVKPAFRLRRLNEKNAEYSMTEPENYRATEGESVRCAGELELELLPFEMMRVDSHQ